MKSSRWSRAECRGCSRTGLGCWTGRPQAHRPPANGQHEAILAGAGRLIQGWEALGPGDRKALIRAMVENVVIMEGAVEIDLSRAGLAERLGLAGTHPPQPNSDGIRLRAEPISSDWGARRD